MMNDREREFAERVEREFLAAHEAHADEIFRHCLIRIRDREIAKDLAQETFARAWRYLSEGKRVDHMRAFLYRVANNLIVDHSRRKRSASLDSMQEEDGFEPADESAQDPTDIQAAREALKLLSELDEMYRVAVTMRYIDELSPREIARALGVSENVVSVRIHRGIEQLRRIARQEPPRS